MEWGTLFSVALPVLFVFLMFRMCGGMMGGRGMGRGCGMGSRPRKPTEDDQKDRNPNESRKEG